MNDDLYLDRPVLAIYPYVRGFGYALFTDENTPKYCGLAIVRSKDIQSYYERIGKMIDAFKPAIIVLPTPDGKYNRKRGRVQGLLSQIDIFATGLNLVVKPYSRDQIRIAFESHNVSSKQPIAEIICKHFPEFAYRCPKPSRVGYAEDYNQAMFDAMSLAITHFYLT